MTDYDTSIFEIVSEEAESYFNGDKSAQDLAGRMTTGDAILLFLDIYGYDQVKNYTQTELKNGFLQLHQAFSVKKGSNPLKELNPLKGLLGR